jgi:gas vesicle protein
VTDEEVIFAIGADTRPFSRELRKLPQIGAAAGKGLKDGFTKAFDIQGTLKQFAAGFGLMFAAHKGAQFIGSIAEMTGEVKRNAEAFGTSTDFVQGWAFAAQQSNVAADAAAKSLAKVTEAIGSAREGNGDAIKKFSDLGVAIKTTDGSARSAENIVLDVADALSKIEDPAKRAALANDLLGKSWEKSLPLFIQGGDAIRELIQKASKLSQEELDSIDRLDDAWKAFITSIKVDGGVAIAFWSDLINKLRESDSWLAKISRYAFIGPVGLAQEMGRQSAGLSGKSAVPNRTLIAPDREAPGEVTPADAAKIAEQRIRLEEELVRLERDFRRLRQTDEQNINDMLQQRQRLQERAADLVEGSNEDLKEETEYLRNEIEIQKLLDKIAEDKARSEKTIADERERAAKAAEREAAAEARIGAKKVEDAIQGDLDLTRAMNQAHGLTVAQVADMDVFRNDPFASQKFLAQDIANAEDAAAFARDSGDIGGFRAWTEFASQLREGLDESVFSPSETGFKAMKEELEKLNAMARGDGLNIKPKNGK